MEARALGRELDEHRHAAVRLGRRGRRRSGRRPPAAPSRVQSSTLGRPVEALGHDRRRDVVGQVRDELRRRRIERGEVELERVAPVERRRSAARRARRGAARASGRARPRGRAPARSARRRVRTPRPGPISSTTSSAPSSASRSITPRMFSSTRKCWPSCFFGRTLTAGGRQPRRWRRSGRRARRHPRRAPRRARRPCGRRARARSAGRGPAAARGTGLSVSARIRSAGTARRGLAQRLGLRVGRVAGEGEVPAALDAGGEQLRLREAVHDDGAVVRAQHRLGVVVRGPGVDDDRQNELRGERKLRREEAALLRPSRRRRSGSRARPPRPRPPSGASSRAWSSPTRSASAVAA